MTTRAEGSMLVAGVDIGTLTCRLLIAEVTDQGALSERRSERRILRLGEGVAQSGRLSEAAMERVVGTLCEWRRIVADAHVAAEVAVATSAVREAANRGVFLSRVAAETAFNVEVISGEEEARRTLLGIRAGLPGGVETILAVDIGGGSTEFILAGPHRPATVRSVELGVVRLTEEWLRDDPPSAGSVRAARAHIRTVTRQVADEMGSLDGATFLGTAGSITSLAAMAQRLPAYESARIHNYRLTLNSVRDLEQWLLARSAAERRGMPGLEAGREEVIVAGAVILREVMELLGYADCLVSDYGLREGVLIDLAEKLASGGAVAQPGRPRGTVR